MVHTVSRSDTDEKEMEVPVKKRFGAIDLGSHTIRLLVAELREGSCLRSIHMERRITRLAQDFQPRQVLNESAMNRSLDVLQEYAGCLKTMEVSAVKCGATGVLRRARNNQEFLDRIRDTTGIVPTMLVEKEEALHSARGVLSVLADCRENMVLFDLGGSSTELTVLLPRNFQEPWCTSVFVGAATITDQYLKGDPPTRKALEQAANHIRAGLAPTLDRVDKILQGSCPSPHSPMLIGTAGTVSTLAAMKLSMKEYRPELINGLTLDYSHIEETVRMLASLTIEKRRCLEGLEPGREEIILGGAMVVQGIMEGLKMRRLTVADAGLLEGLLLDTVETHCGLPKTLVSPLTWRN